VISPYRLSPLPIPKGKKREELIGSHSVRCFLLYNFIISTLFLKYKIISHSDISLKLILVLLSKICLDIKITGSYPESEKQLTYVY